jgi:hypothetical protein
MEFKVVALDGDDVQMAFYETAEATLLALQALDHGFAHSKTGQILNEADLIRLCRPAHAQADGAIRPIALVARRA